MNTKYRSILAVNAAVLLFGTAGLFAKWIALPSLIITLGRVVFSSSALFLYAILTKQPVKLQSRRHAGMLIFAGGILALHWWSFLESIQLSTVAIGTITFSSFPLFVTLLEPIVFKKKLQPRSIGMALLILAGVIITIPEFSIQSQYVKGIAVGMISALSYAVLTIINKRFTVAYKGSTIAMYEQAVAACILLPGLLVMKVQFAVADVALLAVLGILMTAVAHTLFISSLKGITAQLAGICSSMETVYGILLAGLLLGEVPTLRECIGAVVILAVVIYSQWRESK